MLPLPVKPGDLKKVLVLLFCSFGGRGFWPCIKNMARNTAAIGTSSLLPVWAVGPELFCSGAFGFWGDIAEAPKLL